MIFGSPDGTATPDSAVPPGWPVNNLVPTDELVRRQGGGSITSADDLAAVDDPFESDVEYEEFLADCYASRRASLASV